MDQHQCEVGCFCGRDPPVQTFRPQSNQSINQPIDRGIYTKRLLRQPSCGISILFYFKVSWEAEGHANKNEVVLAPVWVFQLQLDVGENRGCSPLQLIRWNCYPGHISCTLETSKASSPIGGIRFIFYPYLCWGWGIGKEVQVKCTPIFFNIIRSPLKKTTCWFKS